MNIYTGETVGEFGAVERWENEGGRISYTQVGRDASTDVIKQTAREGQTELLSQFVLKDYRQAIAPL